MCLKICIDFSFDFKGGLVDEHFLICPIEHYQSAVGQPDDVCDEVEKFKEALKNFYARNNQVPVFFERNFKTSHMQIQAVPIPTAAKTDIEDIFKVFICIFIW